jgi:hypothetical protein
MGISGFTIINSLDNPQGRDQISDIGPNGYVQLLCGILMLLGFVSILQNAMNQKKAVTHSKETGLNSRNTNIKIALTMASLLIFMLLLPYLGFFASSVLLMIANTLIINEGLSKAKEFGFQLLFAVGTVLVLYLSFSVLGGIELP